MPIHAGGRGGGSGGGGGLTLGPPTNEFNAATRAAAETARDTYATANADWLAQYDAEPTYTIILSWPSTPTDTIYQARREGAWADVTGLLEGPEGPEGPPGEDGELDDGLTIDTLVFWSPTNQHSIADNVRFSDTVRITYGGSNHDVYVYNLGRNGHICTLVLEPSPASQWEDFDTVASPTIAKDGDQFGSWITASRQTNRDDVATAGQWFRVLAEAGAGSEVWREIDRIDEVDDTHLTVGDRTATTLELRSSTGDDVLIPSATNTEAGLESAEDKEMLEALPPKWTVGTYSVGTERSWAQKIYRCVVDRTVADTDNPAADTTGWSLGVTSSHTGVTNLSVGNRTATSFEVESDTGTDATLPSASRTQAGLQSAADKAKLDGVATGAQVNVQADWNETQSTAQSYIENKPTIPDISPYRTLAQINALIATALADDGSVIDAGEYDATESYDAKSLVYTTGSGAATYLAKIAVTANTQASTGPGTGTAWETSWVRIGYQDGPPNAFVGTSVSGRHMTFTREGGTNPLSVELPIGTGQLVVETLGSAGYDVTTPLNYTAQNSDDQPIDVSDVQDTDILAVRASFGLTAEADLIWFTGADIEKNVSVGDAATGPVIKLTSSRLLRLGSDSNGHLLITENNVNNDPDPLTLWKVGGNNAPAGSTRVERITFQAEASGDDAFDAQPLATNPATVQFGDGAPQIITNVGAEDFDLATGVYQFRAYMPLPAAAGRNSLIYVHVRNASDDSDIAIFPTTRANSNTPDIVVANGVLYLSQDTTVNIQIDRVDGPAIAVPANWYIELARWGGGVSGFNPGALGTATFDLDGTAQSVTLTDDTSGANIICPPDGWIVAVVTVPGVGLNGSVSFQLAEDLRNADEDDTLTAGLYTDSDNNIILGLAEQDGGATTDNKALIFHTGTVTASSSGAQPVINPSILEFNVTGDSHVTGASIADKVYTYDSRISQSSHVGAARIVGFAGSGANPPNVSSLATLTDYAHDTGSIRIPVGTTLASVGDVYTIRLEVYPTGTPITTAPTIYHDYRIERIAPSAQVHFGYVRGGADYARAALLVDFANDIGDPRAGVAGNYTVDDIPDDTNLYRLYWAVPSNITQPSGWEISGFTIANSVDTAGQSRDIGSDTYIIYVTDEAYDSTSNTLTTIAVSTG